MVIDFVQFCTKSVVYYMLKLLSAKK